MEIRGYKVRGTLLEKRIKERELKELLKQA
jgi:hypothetical protein